MLTTVIAITYNRADYLALTLKSLCRQEHDSEYEIIVGDDGSTDHTEQVVDQCRSESARPIHYIKQEDQGFRKVQLLNRCVREQAGGDLLIFLDCDCIPDMDFVHTYRHHATDNAFYLGGVYALSQLFTETVLTQAATIQIPDLIQQARRSENQKSGAARRVRKRYWKSRLYATLHWRQPKIWGGNFAVNRDVFEAINGFDENYIGYGQEDSDIRNRMLKGGYLPVCLHTLARTFHLWHPPSKAHQEKGDGGRKDRHNRAYYNRPDIDVVCRNGLRRLPD